MLIRRFVRLVRHDCLKHCVGERCPQTSCLRPAERGPQMKLGAFNDGRAAGAGVTRGGGSRLWGVGAGLESSRNAGTYSGGDKFRLGRKIPGSSAWLFPRASRPSLTTTASSLPVLASCNGVGRPQKAEPSQVQQHGFLLGVPALADHEFQVPPRRGRAHPRAEMRPGRVVVHVGRATGFERRRRRQHGRRRDCPAAPTLRPEVDGRRVDEAGRRERAALVSAPSWRGARKAVSTRQSGARPGRCGRCAWRAPAKARSPPAAQHSSQRVPGSCHSVRQSPCARTPTTTSSAPQGIQRAAIAAT